MAGIGPCGHETKDVAGCVLQIGHWGLSVAAAATAAADHVNVDDEKSNNQPNKEYTKWSKGQHSLGE